MLSSLKKIRKAIHIDIIAGNIATAEAAEDLISMGVDGLRVGIAGFIVMIYGAIKREKPKNPYDPDDPYNIDNIKL